MEEFLQKIKEGYYLYPPILTVRESLDSRYVKENYEIKVSGKLLSDENMYNDISDLELIHEYGKRLGLLNNTELFLYFMNITYFKVIIKYNHFEVTNSNKVSHHIYDIFNELNFTHKGRSIHYDLFKMIRTTFSEEELISGYSFSHRNGIYDWGGCCLGGSSDLRKLANKLNSESYIMRDSLDFTRVLMSLEQFYQWENIGSPHRRISNISRRDDTITRFNVSNGALKDRHIIKIFNENKEIILKELEPVYNRGNILLIPSRNFNEIVSEIIFKNNKDVPYCYQIYDNGKFIYTSGNISNNEGEIKTILRKFPTIKFKGEIIPIKVLDSTSKDLNKNAKKIVHISYLKSMIKYLERYLNESVIYNKILD